jgi:hypothetical protein
MSTQYRLVQSGKTASGGCSAGQGSLEPVAPRIYLFIFYGRNTKHEFRLALFLVEIFYLSLIVSSGCILGAGVAQAV